MSDINKRHTNKCIGSSAGKICTRGQSYVKGLLGSKGELIREGGRSRQEYGNSRDILRVAGTGKTVRKYGRDEINAKISCNMLVQ